MDPSVANNFMPVMAEFFESIEGVMVRPNIADRSTVDITAFYNEAEIVVTLPRQSSLFRLHKAIQERLPQVRNFRMTLTEGDKIITFVEEEDFSVKSLESKNNKVRVDPIEKHYFFDALAKFKSQISKSKVYDALINLLNVPTTQQ